MTELEAHVMPEADARRLTERIRSTLDTTARGLDRLASYVSEAYSQRADLALGYGSWHEYAEAEFGEQTRDLAAPIRRELVSYLSVEGMSTRAIAPAVGVSQQAVSKAQRHHEVTTKLSPEVGSEVDLSRVDKATGEIRDEEPAESLSDWRHRTLRDAEDSGKIVPLTGPGSVSDPAPPKVTGLDGKEYTRPAPKPEPSKPRRAPLTDAFFKAAYDLRKNVERLERLVEDDRFTQNREQVALRHENDLNRTAEALTGVLRAINNR